MSYVLRQNGIEIQRCFAWQPQLFGKLTNTSFPREVDQSYVWQSGDLAIAWEVDEAPAPAPFADLKAEKINMINIARDTEEASGFSYLNKMFDCDPLSVQRISVAAQAAQLDPNFAIGWAAQDNTVVQLNQTQMLGMPAALATHAYTLHVRARQLKDQVAAATTPAELDLINW